jgi:glyoxylase-like metal-dependent hydrolase (beta-lactamase superfamily II)
MTIEQPNQVQLGQGVYAFVSPRLGFGFSNIGLVIDHDGLTVVDTSATPAQAAVTAQAIIQLTADLDLPVKRVILTSSRVPFSGGGQRFWSAAFYGTEATSEQLDAPANPLAFRRLLPQFATTYSDEFTTRPITHTVSEPVQLTPAIMAIPLVGESAGNLAIYVESANVIFAGALASFRVTPLAFDGYPRNWIESLGQIASLGATVVPGHGPPGGSVDLTEMAAYLEACHQADATAGLSPGPWNDWSDRRFDAINIERARTLNQGVDQIPQAMLTLLGM